MTATLFDSVPLGLVYVGTVLLALLVMEGGYRLGRARVRRAADASEGSIGALVGATLAMLAFFLAFLVGSSADRFGTRRQLVVDEANAIRTLYLRAGYTQAPYPQEIRPLLAEYVDVRLSALDPQQTEQAIARSEQIHLELWAQVESLAKKDSSDVTALVVESTNEVIDLHTLRVRAANLRIPDTMWLVIYVLSGLAMFMVGLENGYAGRHNLIAVVALALAYSAVILLIASLDRPTGGLLQVSQQALVDVQRFIQEFP
jgi:hypothetical protein